MSEGSFQPTRDKGLVSWKHGFPVSQGSYRSRKNERAKEEELEQMIRP
jgi:hypothetical protein